ncbi:MAG: TauD/TfdA family dioxygenase [Vulcanimicrobiaceae bacterium]
MKIEPSGATLGARIEGVDLAAPLDQADFATIVHALAAHGVLCFPQQRLDPARLKAFSAHFGALEINVANAYQAAGHPEVMILSNKVADGRPVGLADAGQDWHSDMSYAETIAYTNVLHGLEIPHRDGAPLGATLFADMRAAYDDLSPAVAQQIASLTATHDFNMFWEKMRTHNGSTRPPLSEAQRASRPPVSHPMVLTHPITGRRALYANPGYTVKIDGMPAGESRALLDELFAHQLDERYRYAHAWTPGDVLMWDNLSTLHNAVADYGPNEHRLIIRCQVMADRVFAPDFLAGEPAAARV